MESHFHSNNRGGTTVGSLLTQHEVSGPTIHNRMYRRVPKLSPYGETRLHALKGLAQPQAGG